MTGGDFLEGSLIPKLLNGRNILFQTLKDSSSDLFRINLTYAIPLEALECQQAALHLLKCDCCLKIVWKFPARHRIAMCRRIDQVKPNKAVKCPEALAVVRNQFEDGESASCPFQIHSVDLFASASIDRLSMITTSV